MLQPETKSFPSPIYHDNVLFKINSKISVDKQNFTTFLVTAREITKKYAAATDKKTLLIDYIDAFKTGIPETLANLEKRVNLLYQSHDSSIVPLAIQNAKSLQVCSSDMFKPHAKRILYEFNMATTLFTNLLSYADFNITAVNMQVFITVLRNVYQALDLLIQDMDEYIEFRKSLKSTVLHDSLALELAKCLNVAHNLEYDIIDLHYSNFTYTIFLTTKSYKFIAISGHVPISYYNKKLGFGLTDFIASHGGIYGSIICPTKTNCVHRSFTQDCSDALQNDTLSKMLIHCPFVDYYPTFDLSDSFLLIYDPQITVNTGSTQISYSKVPFLLKTMTKIKLYHSSFTHEITLKRPNPYEIKHSDYTMADLTQISNHFYHPMYYFTKHRAATVGIATALSVVSVIIGLGLTIFIAKLISMCRSSCCEHHNGFNPSPTSDLHTPRAPPPYRREIRNDSRVFPLLDVYFSNNRR